MLLKLKKDIRIRQINQVNANLDDVVYTITNTPKKVDKDTYECDILGDNHMPYQVIISLEDWRLAKETITAYTWENKGTLVHERFVVVILNEKTGATSYFFCGSEANALSIAREIRAKEATSFENILDGLV